MHFFSLFSNFLFSCLFIESSTLNSPVEEPTDVDKEDAADDETGLQGKHAETDVSRALIQPRWPTRVFAIECLLKIMQVCEGNRAHIDLALAKELKRSGKGG